MTALAATVGGLADQMFGEPALRWHPVARYGSVMQHIERHVYADRRVNGIAFTAIGAGLGIGTGLVLRRAIGPALASVAATCMSAAGKMLEDEAVTMAGLLTAGDLPAARQRVISLVGRNTDHLDEHQIGRAV
ncbi:MAG: cobD, partial [Ilumatobacteraceae bacterium]|nr:cobD [Ilumatobacteraceae bacterium]